MNVDTATMKVDWWEARRKYREYQDAVKKRATTDPVGAAKSDDEQLRKAFLAIASGKTVLDINLAIAGGGLYPTGLPQLAIARADWPNVHAWWYEQRCVFTGASRWEGRGTPARRVSHSVAVRFPGGLRPPSFEVEGRAQVPSIPPKHRPPGDLSLYRLLFEAEWQRVPPVDPILLRHLAGPFYVVLAQWDLSPLEQATLRAKL